MFSMFSFPFWHWYLRIAGLTSALTKWANSVILELQSNSHLQFTPWRAHQFTITVCIEHYRYFTITVYSAIVHAVCSSPYTHWVLHTNSLAQASNGGRSYSCVLELSPRHSRRNSWLNSELSILNCLLLLSAVLFNNWLPWVRYLLCRPLRTTKRRS
jgi:hypothetical protein